MVILSVTLIRCPTVKRWFSFFLQLFPLWEFQDSLASVLSVLEILNVMFMTESCSMVFDAERSRFVLTETSDISALFTSKFLFILTLALNTFHIEQLIRIQLTTLSQHIISF